jgi:AcrR family transcriptional regulator
VVTVQLTSTASALDNRRERKKQETRAALETAAMRLFLERGYEQTTVEDIASAADVAVRTFFRYFSSKQHILFGDVANDIADRLAETLADRPMDEHPVDSVYAALEALQLTDPVEQRQIIDRLRLLEQIPELTGTYLTVMHSLHLAIVAFVAKRTGQSTTIDLYPQLVGGAAVAAIQASLAVVLSRGVGSPEVERSAYQALTAGLRTIS